MTPERTALASAIAEVGAAREAHASISTAIGAAEDEAARLTDRADALEAAERRRSQGLAARVIAAVRAGHASPMTEPPSHEATAARLERLALGDRLGTAATVIDDLHEQLARAANDLAAREHDVRVAADAVLRVDALSMAAELVAVRAKAAILTRRLKMYADTLPLTGAVPGLTVGYRIAPFEVTSALNNKPAADATEIWFTGDGSLPSIFKVEIDAWRSWQNALAADPTALPSFATA